MKSNRTLTSIAVLALLGAGLWIGGSVAAGSEEARISTRLEVAVEVAPDPEQPDVYRCTARIRDLASGEMVSAPTLIVASGEEARATTGLSPNELVELSIRVDPERLEAHYTWQVKSAGEVQSSQQVTIRLGADDAASPYVEALNLGFEAADTPEGWYAGGKGFVAAIDHEIRHGGERSLRITFDEEVEGGFGVATGRFPVADARGKRLRLSGYLKTEDVSSGFAGLWMRVDGSGRPLAFDNMHDRGVTGTTDWTRYEIVLEVPEEADNINFGAILPGKGTLWVDDLAFDFVEPAPPPPSVTVRGRVEDPDGGTIGGAVVALSRSLTSRAQGRARTGEDGRFAIEVPAGTYSLTATAPGFTAAFQKPKYLGPEETAEDQKLVLGRDGFTVSGRVTDDRGEPVGGVPLVFLRWDSDLAGGQFYVETDTAGRYSVRLAPAEMYALEVASKGLTTTTRAIESGVDQTIDVRVVERGPAPEEVVAWIRKHAVPLATAEPEKGLDDMKPLAETIGDARVVALGEATHGTREIFQLKHRFLEYLVEELGFTVFAIEANWPESLAINDYVLHGHGDAKEALAGIYFWTWDTEEVLALIEWMRRYNADPTHETKVKFYGFDMQASQVAAAEALAYLERVDAEAAAALSLAPLDDLQAMQAFKALGAEERRRIEETLDDLLDRLDARRERYVASSSEREWTLARQQVAVLRQAARLYGSDHAFNTRDQAMAANVHWILDTEPPGTRIVAWAHNGHVTRYSDAGLRPMGSHLAASLGDDYVAFGFVFNRGSFQAMDWTEGTNKPGGLREHTVGPAPEDHVGAAFARAGPPIFVLDLRRLPTSGPVASWFGVPQPMRAIGAVFSGEESMSSPLLLPEHFDGVIFVDTTSRARPVKR